MIEEQNGLVHLLNQQTRDIQALKDLIGNHATILRTHRKQLDLLAVLVLVAIMGAVISMGRLFS